MSHSRAPLFASAVFCLFALLVTLLPSLGRAQAAEHVVISEVMYRPVGVQPDQEWIELYNPGSGAIDLSSYKLGDEETRGQGEGMFKFPVGAVIAPNGVLVIANKAAAFATLYGFQPHYELSESDPTVPNLNKYSAWSSGSVALSDDSDELILLDGDDSIIDIVAYGRSSYPLFQPTVALVDKAGISIERFPSDMDTDGFADWRAQIASSPGVVAVGVLPPASPTTTDTAIPTVTSTATPIETAAATATSTSTAASTPLPTTTSTPTASATSSATPSTAQPGDVIINEIMQNPAAVSDTAGEWFEVYNASGHTIDLNGWTIKDAGTEQHRIQAGAPLWLPAGGYLVLGRNADASSNGGVPVAYRYASFTLGNADDEIILLNGSTEIDRVAYDGGQTFPDPDGASMQLIRPDLDNTDGANWRVSPAPWPGSKGDRGSPGAPNHTARIQGYVYEDLNGNRARDAAEPGIADVIVSLNDGHTTRTIASGWYGFADLAPGAYEVSATQPAGYTSTTPDRRTVTVALGALALGPSFGEQRLPPTATPTAGPSPTPTPSRWSRLLLSEVLYNAPQEGTDSAYEWVEIVNPGEAPVSLAGWALSDNGGRDALPAADLDPGEYLVIAATAAGFRTNHPNFTGKLLSLEGSIGNGLSNTSDVVHLLAPDGTVIDAMSYGENTTAFAPPCPDVPAGQSLARVPHGTTPMRRWTGCPR